MKLPLLKAPRTSFKANSTSAWLITLSVLIGVLTGVVGGTFRVLLNKMVEVRHLYFRNPELLGPYGLVAGICIATLSIWIGLSLVRRFAREAGGSGIQEIEGGLDGLRPFRWQRVLPVKYIASLFTIGPGLLLGREGPTVQIGANIGKMVKDLARQPEHTNNPLVSAGAAAGLAAAFDAPLAGTLFVIEEMAEHFQFNFLSVSCVMLGSSVASIVGSVITDTRIVIPMTVFPMPSFESMWIFLLFGLCAAVIGLLFNILQLSFLDLMRRLQLPPIVSALVLACIVVLVGTNAIQMVGADDGVINHIFTRNYTVTGLVILFVVRMLLGMLCYSSGVPGGIFAPMIILGITFGMIFGTLVQQWLPGLNMPPELFAVVGMGSFFAATVRAPLTGVILVAEMTSNYEMLLPLVLAATTAAIFTTFLGNRPIYASLLARTLEAAEEEKRKAAAAAKEEVQPEQEEPSASHP